MNFGIRKALRGEENGGEKGGKGGAGAGGGEDVAVLRKQNKELAEKISAFEKMQQESKEAELKKNNEWKQIAEANEKKALESDAKVKRIENSYQADKKLSAIREAALKLGLRDEALDDLENLDFNDHVSIEATTKGKLNIHGAEKFAERVKTLKPHWFQDPAAAVDTSNPKIKKSGKTGLDELSEAEAKYRKSKSDEDRKAYHEAYEKYRNQA